MSDAALHQKMLSKLARRDAVDVTFSLAVAGTYNETTDRYDNPTSVSIPGKAVEMPGDPEEYDLFELLESNPATLIFAPTTLGEKPEAGYTVTWAGELRTVKRVFPYRPGGVAVGSRVIVV